MPSTLENQKSEIGNQQPLPTTARGSWNFSTDIIKANTTHYNAEARNAILNLFLWCTHPAHPLSKPDAAARIGCSDNLLYKLCTGKYRGPENELLQPAPELIASIHAFLAIAKERFESGENQFVLTPTSKKVINACELARESNSIVFLWGPSHIGKTWALEHHAANVNHGRTPYVRMAAATGVSNMIRRIAQKLGISDNSNTEHLTDRIRSVLTKDTVILLDEMHLLFNTILRTSADRCFETLRGLHDETRCGMVWSFTILDEMKARSGAQLQQAWRRGVHKVPLPLMPTREDLKTIVEHNGLEWPDPVDQVTVGRCTEKPYEVFRHVAKTEGLKAITERLRYGRKLANKSGRKFDWAHVIAAHLLIAKNAQQEGEWK